MRSIEGFGRKGSQVSDLRAQILYLSSQMAAVCFLLLVVLLVQGGAQAQAGRVGVIKVGGLPYDVVDRFVRERDPRTGKSQLPWFERIFYDGGTRVANFYVRGMSLAGPSWSLLD